MCILLLLHKDIMMKRKKEKKKKKKKKRTRDENINYNNDVKENSLFSISRNNRNSLKFTEKSNFFVIFENTHIFLFSKFTFLAKKKQL